MTNVDGLKKISKKKLQKSRELVLEEIEKSKKRADEKNIKKESQLDNTVFLKNNFYKYKKKEKVKNIPGQKIIAPNFKEEEEKIDKKELIATKLKIEREKEKIIKKTKNQIKKNNSFLEILLKKIKNLKKTKKSKKFYLKKQIKNIKFWKFANFKQSFVYVFFVILLSFLLVLLFYVFMLVAVTRLNFNSYLFRYFSKYLPVPAFIIDNKIIDYYKFADFKKRLSYKYPNIDNIDRYAKIFLLREIVLSDLKKKYDTNNLEEIKYYFARDKDFNKIAYKRILKIKNMIKKDSDFVKIGNKYGDKQGKMDFSSLNDFVDYFGEGVKFLKIGEISDIISLSDGYYIVKRYQKRESAFPISYIFVQNTDFNDFLNQRILNLDIVSFVD